LATIQEAAITHSDYLAIIDAYGGHFKIREFNIQDAIGRMVDIPDYTAPPQSGLKNTPGVLTFRRMLTLLVVRQHPAEFVHSLFFWFWFLWWFLNQSPNGTNNSKNATNHTSFLRKTVRIEV